MNERFNDLWVMVQQDRKKAATLGALMLVAFAMGIRAIVSGAGGPSKASAAAPAAKSGAGPAPKAAALTIEQSLASLRPQQRLALAGAPPRDLFHSTWAVIGGLESEGGGKSPAGLADNATGAPPEDPRALVESEAAGLRLRSTLLGGNPLAVIERAEGGATRRQVARLGESVEGFRVIRIEAHEIEVEKDGVRVVIEQSRPTP